MTTNVVVDVNNDLNSALRYLRKQMNKDGTLREIRRREHYRKPSVAKWIKSALARKRQRRVAQRRVEREARSPHLWPKDRVA